MRFLFILLILITMLSSCTSNEKKNLPESQKLIREQDDININNKKNENAKLIANEILKIEEVDRAVVVISGNKALIGLRVRNTSSKNKEYFESTISQKIHQINSDITSIYVTTDSNMYNRIKKLNEDINNNKPLKGVLENFMMMFSDT